MEIADKEHWSGWQRQLFRFAFVWVGLMLATFPYPRPYLPDLGKLLLPITTPIAAAVADLFGIRHPLTEIASDTVLMYVHMALLLVLALAASALWGWRDRRATGYPRLYYVWLVAMRYFLAAAMLSYGFAKVFKTQFYLPEPNTLFTPLGNVPRDLLFWSTTGASHSYNVFTGWVEVLVGLLLFFRGSRLAGALLGTAVMGNVVVINLSFDISVKIYASLLLLLCLLLLTPDLGRIWALLRGQALPARSLWVPAFATRGRRMAYAGAKSLVVCALLFDSVGQNFETSNFNDDRALRPPFHGAYEVTQFVSNSDTLPPDLRQAQRWRRVFVHRQGYLIVQDMQDRMQDYAMTLSPDLGQMQLLDAQRGVWDSLQVEAVGNALTGMRGVMAGDTLAVELRQLDWRAMPLLQGEFHWTSDEI
jgi:hypothetical protein